MLKAFCLCLLSLGLLAPVVAVSGAAAQTASRPAASSQDIVQRDRLIAAQENLLNAYRCMFGVDAEAVPGGCGDPETVVPGPAPQNPAQSDLEVRDGLIRDQEALLNVYRCRFDIDTGLVPGGCPDQTGEQPAGQPDYRVLWGFELFNDGSLALELGGLTNRVGLGGCIVASTFTLNDGEYGYHEAWWERDAGSGWREVAGSRRSGKVCGFDLSSAPPGKYRMVLDATIAGARGVYKSRNEITKQPNTESQTEPERTTTTTEPTPEPEPETTTFTAISAGTWHSCGIRADSTAVCWGDNNLGRADAPAGAFTAISASANHSCGIRADRTAVCWGNNEYGESDAPAGAFTAISAGTWHSCGIRADSTAVCWGDNEDQYGYYVGQADAPEGAFTAISAGFAHSCGIRADSTAVCWGDNNLGRADAPAGAFTAISAGRVHSCGIRADRTAVCWGANNLGRADAPAGAFTAISAGRFHSCGIRADRTAVCWGANNFGRADAPAGAFTAISAGRDHSCGIRADRTAVCWGSNYFGQADAPGAVRSP